MVLWLLIFNSSNKNKAGDINSPWNLLVFCCCFFFSFFFFFFLLLFCVCCFVVVVFLSYLMFVNHRLFLIAPSFGASGRLYVLILVVPGYYYLLLSQRTTNRTLRPVWPAKTMISLYIQRSQLSLFG